MILGVTATHHPLTDAQRVELRARIRHPSVTEVHHGDCISGDEYAHSVALVAGKKIVVHPPVDPKLRAFCYGPPDQVTVLEPKPYIQRNHDIVHAVHAFVAVPFGAEKSYPRSGTWAAYRYAWKTLGPKAVSVIRSIR